MHHRYLYCLSVISFLSVTHCCNSFGKILAEITPKHGEVFNKTIKGCISRQSLNISDSAQDVKIINQPVKSLKVGAIENMASLTNVEFQRCPIEALYPRCFRNVPRLQRILINNGLLTEIKNNVFVNITNLKKISLAHHKISTIENGSFDIPSLQILHVPYNQLRKWDKYWFSSVENLVEIDLRDNLISELSSNAFINFQNLSKVILDCNVITNIERNAFKGLYNLKYLGLTYNLLTEIDISWFPNRINLSKLTISANKLNYIALKVLDKIKPKQILLDGNPWKCECWEKVLMWVHNNTGTIVTNESCVYENVPVCISGENPNKCVEMVDENSTQQFFDEVRKTVKDINSAKKMKCYQFV